MKNPGLAPKDGNIIEILYNHLETKPCLNFAVEYTFCDSSSRVIVIAVLSLIFTPHCIIYHSFVNVFVWSMTDIKN